MDNNNIPIFLLLLQTKEEYMQNKYRKIIVNVFQNVTLPVKDEFPFFIVVVLLLIVPTYLDTFIFEYDGAPVLQKLSRNHNGTSIPVVFFLPFLFAYTMVIISKIFRSRWILKVILFFLFLLYSVNLFLLFNFDTLITPMILTLIAETETGESSEFLASYLLSSNSVWTYSTIFVTVLIIWYLNSFREFFSSLFSNFYLRGLILIVTSYFFYRGIPLFLYFTKMYQCETLAKIETFSYDFAVKTNTITELLYSFYNREICKNEARKVVSNAKNAVNSQPKQMILQDSLSLIVIIGESYNKYHSPLYGYSLSTTPKMLKERDDSCLFVFTNVITPWNMTSNALKDIFSTNSVSAHESWADFPFFPVLFKSAGYLVYFWDNQNSGVRSDVFDYSLNGIIHNPEVAKVSYDVENNQRYQYDGDFLDSFKRAYSYGKRDLIILHLMGQHIGAKYRYPESYGRFCVDDYSQRNLSKDEKQAIAEYDNATLYNDSIVGEVFDMFRDHDAIVVYFSDHGEEVYDYRNVIGRTHEETKSKDNLKYQYDVPFVIWCSNSYAKKNPDMIKMMQQSTEKPFMTDLTSQLLLGLGRVSTKYYHSERDLLNSQYLPSKRIVQGYLDYDQICGNK